MSVFYSTEIRKEDQKQFAFTWMDNIHLKISLKAMLILLPSVIV